MVRCRLIGGRTAAGGVDGAVGVAQRRARPVLAAALRVRAGAVRAGLVGGGDINGQGVEQPVGDVGGDRAGVAGRRCWHDVGPFGERFAGMLRPASAPGHWTCFA
jgi:hypothetical protein